MPDKRTGRFEEAMKSLEEIIAKLDSGSVELDERVELFKRGMALSRECEGLLKAAQEQIDRAMQGPEVVTVPEKPDEGIPF